MLEFSYKAVTADGALTQGVIHAATEQAAALALQRRNLIVLRINAGSTMGEMPSAPSSGRGKRAFSSFSKSVPSSGAKTASPARGRNAGPGGRTAQSGRSGLFAGRPGPKDLVLFAENLAILLKAGIPLSRSLSVLTDLTEKRRLREVVQDVSNRIREGSTLWQALQHHAAVFPPVFVNMVRAGESAGVLETVLSRLAEYLAGIQELKEYLISSMIYPAILGVTAGASILLMLTLVVPKFAEIFSDIGVELPFATQVMLGAGNFLQSYWLVLTVIIVLVVLGLRMVVRQPAGRLAWDRMKLGMPLVGPLVRKIEIARFSRTLGTLLGSGLSILGAMNIVKGVILNQVLRQALERAYDDLKQGTMLSSALERRQVVPPLAVHMLGVGEETGALDTMLTKIGEMYDKELKRTIKSITALFEPLVILLMGLVIGAMVVSMLLAIFSINEVAM